MATIILSFFSCKEEGPQDFKTASLTLVPTSLSVSTGEISFNSPQPSTATFLIKSTNVEWQITGIPDWITLTPTSGNGSATVSVSVTENSLPANRLGILTLKSSDDTWSLAQTIAISQFRAVYYAKPDTDRVEFDGAAATASIKVTSNVDDWTVKAGASMDWCTVTKVDGGVNITVTPNTASTSRSGLIEIATPDGTEYVTVLQRPANISSTIAQLEFPMDGGAKNIEINSQAPWSAATSYSWITVTPQSGSAGTTTVQVEVTPNYSLSARSGYVYLVLSDDNKIEIPVSQEPVTFSVDRTELTSVASGSTETVAVQSNASWSIKGDIPSWIQVEPKTGSGNGQVKVTFARNTELDERTCTITISPDNIDYPTTIKVSQSGVLDSDSTQMHFSPKAGSMYLALYTEMAWTAVSSDTWISLDATSGTGNYQLKVSVTENTADTVRTGYVAVMVEGMQIKISVIQQGQYLNVSSKYMSFSSRGGNIQVSLKSNNNWSATADNDWITLSDTEGDGDCNLTITAADNPSVTFRTAHVDIVQKGNNSVQIMIGQVARYLKVSASDLQFSYKGGTSDPITIDTDGVAWVSADSVDSDWLTIKMESDNQFTITASKNDGQERTGKVTVILTDIVDGTISRDITVKQAYSPYNGHDYVDLGLSVKWATCNVGATKPEGYGNQYAWGETEYKSYCSWSNYKYCNGSNMSMTKYCNDSSYGYDGFTDNKTTLDLNDDVARVKWGGNWRMPTRAEFIELLIDCTWTRTTRNGVYGCEVRSTKSGYTDRSIFLPAAGTRSESGLGHQGTNGGYWSSSLYGLSSYAYGLTFNNGSQLQTLEYFRYIGWSVRPVCP